MTPSIWKLAPSTLFRQSRQTNKPTNTGKSRENTHIPKASGPRSWSKSVRGGRSGNTLLACPKPTARPWSILRKLREGNPIWHQRVGERFPTRWMLPIRRLKALMDASHPPQVLSTSYLVDASYSLLSRCRPNRPEQWMPPIETDASYRALVNKWLARGNFAIFSLASVRFALDFARREIAGRLALLTRIVAAA